MPSKKKKYNARFPAGRIKKIMQTDEDVGKVAQAVPVIISRTLELFVESLLKRAEQITSAKNAKTLTPSHMKQCILSESRFDFLKDLVKGIPDVSSTEDESGSLMGAAGIGAHSSTAKSPTRYSRFQFRRKSDGGVSKPSATTSQHCTISQPVLPRFYNEIEIGGEDSKKEEEEPAPCGTPAIYQAGTKVNHTPPPISSYGDYIKSHSLPKGTAATSSTASTVTNTAGANKANYILSEKNKVSSDDDEEEDEDDDYEENGYHRLQIVTKPCAVDEDYDA